MFLPTFWPVRVPNNVLPEEQYEIVMNEKKPYTERYEAFKFDNRRYWLRALPPRANYKAVINTFVKEWNEVWIVTRSPGVPPTDRSFPQTMFVEMGMNVKPPKPPKVAKKALKGLAAEAEAAVDADDRPENLPNPRDFR